MTRTRRQPPEWVHRHPTKPTAGVPVHGGPVVTQVVFETTAPQESTTAAKYAAQLMARTVGHLEKVDVGAIVTAYLEGVDAGLDPASLHQLLDHEELGAEILRLTALVETVLDQAKSTLRTRMAMDLATTLIPRLERES